MGWKERLHEDFSSGLGDLLSNAGNGAIVASGGELSMTTPNGVDCNWWTTADQNGPSVYRDLGRYNVSGSHIYMVEFYVKEHNKTAGSDESTIIVALERDLANYYLMQNHYANSDYWNIGRIDTDAWVSIWAGDWSGRYRPGWYRLYVHGGEKRVLFHERGNDVWLNPGWIGLGFSRERDNFTDDVWMYENTFLTQNYPVDLLNFRIVKKSYGSFPETEGVFQDLRVYEWEYDEEVFEGGPDDPENGAAGRSMGAEDDAQYSIGESYEVRLPSGADEPHVEDKIPPTAMGMEDDLNYDIGGPTIPSQRQGNKLAHGGAYLVGETSQQDGDRHTRQMPIAMRDALSWRRGAPVQFRQDTLDPEAHPHFEGLKVLHMFYYRTEGEPWDNPTLNNFTGYARDGDHYTNGVLDAGPVEAPWAQEFPSGNRSARKDFPEESLIVTTNDEVVIFDLDNWPTTLGVWMRFEVDPTDYNMLGRYDGMVTATSMANGILAVSKKYNGTDYGGITFVNFKRDGEQHCAHMIRSNNHWWWSSGFDIRNRNENRWTTTGVPLSLRVNPEYMYSVSIFDDHNGKAWIAGGGEDLGPQVLGLEDGEPQWMGYASGPSDQMGIDNHPDGYNTRQVLFDESGWLWFSIENRLYRNVFDYKGGVMVANQAGINRGVTFENETIRALAQGRNYVYVGTDRGVYRVHKGSLKANLAYTVAGGGGGGLLDNPPDGEILAGTSPKVIKMHCVSTDKSSILQVITETSKEYLGSITTIRLTDDFIIASKAYPDIPEDAPYAGASTIGN